MMRFCQTMTSGKSEQDLKIQSLRGGVRICDTVECMRPWMCGTQPVHETWTYNTDQCRSPWTCNTQACAGAGPSPYRTRLQNLSPNGMVPPVQAGQHLAMFGAQHVVAHARFLQHGQVLLVRLRVFAIRAWSTVRHAGACLPVAWPYPAHGNAA